MSQERDKFEAFTEYPTRTMSLAGVVLYEDSRTEDQWKAWLASRRAALEEAAQVADRNVAGTTAGGSHANGMRSMAQHLANVIRKLGEGA